jgi:hypothetical protein
MEEKFVFEYTWLREHTALYSLGNENFHLAFEADNYNGMHFTP